MIIIFEIFNQFKIKIFFNYFSFSFIFFFLESMAKKKNNLKLKTKKVRDLKSYQQQYYNKKNF